MAFWWSSSNLSVSCCLMCGNMTLQQCFLNFFCRWLLTRKQHLIHSFFIEVIIVFLWIYWPIYGLGRCDPPFQLIFMLFIFDAHILLEDIFWFCIFAVPQCLANFLSTCPVLAINCHNFNCHIFNRNTVKIRYSCMSNISSIISVPNKNLLNPTVNKYDCNCRIREY